MGKKFLVFRPYIDPMTIKPYLPPDKGYYFKMKNIDIKIVRYTLEDNGFRHTEKDWLIMWSASSLKSSVYPGLTKYQKVNHFPKASELTRKNVLSKNIQKMQALHGDHNFDILPKTFILPQDYSAL